MVPTPDRVPVDCEDALSPKPQGGEAVTKMSATGLIRTPACTGMMTDPIRVRMEARSGKAPEGPSSMDPAGGRQGGDSCGSLDAKM